MATLLAYYDEYFSCYRREKLKRIRYVREIHPLLPGYVYGQSSTVVDVKGLSALSTRCSGADVSHPPQGTPPCYHGAPGYHTQYTHSTVCTTQYVCSYVCTLTTKGGSQRIYPSPWTTSSVCCALGNYGLP